MFNNCLYYKLTYNICQEESDFLFHPVLTLLLSQPERLRYTLIQTFLPAMLTFISSVFGTSVTPLRFLIKSAVPA